MQEKTFHQQRVSNFGLVLITLIKYWKREKIYQNDHLFSWYSDMSFYIRCSKCGQLYSTLFSDTISFFSNRCFFSFSFLYMSNNQFFFHFPYMLNVVSFAHVIRKRYLNTVLFVLQNTSNVSDSTFFFPFNICTIADHVLSCILGKFKYNHQKKRKVEFFSVFVSTHHQFKCCQNKNTNENSHVNGQRLQTEKNVNRRKTKSNKFNILRCVFFFERVFVKFS